MFHTLNLTLGRKRVSPEEDKVMVVAIFIDGKNLQQFLQKADPDMGEMLEGSPMELNDWLNETCGREGHEGRNTLLTCQCGSSGCRELTAKIEHLRGKVRWFSFYDSLDPTPLAASPEFYFKPEQYRSQLKKLEGWAALEWDINLAVNTHIFIFDAKGREIFIFELKDRFPELTTQIAEAVEAREYSKGYFINLWEGQEFSYAAQLRKLLGEDYKVLWKGKEW